MLIEIPEHVQELAPWSYTMADKALTCPYAFHKKYRLKEKETGEESTAMVVGKIVHSILEWVTQGAEIDRAFANATQVYKMTYDVSQEVPCFREAVEDFAASLERFDKKIGIVKMFPERKMAVNCDWKPVKFLDKSGLFRGIADLTIITKRACGIIIDHKSGAVKPLDKYLQQLQGYSVFADVTVPNLRTTRGAVHHVGADKNEKGTRTMWGPEYSVEVVRTKFRKDLVTYLTRAADAATESREPKKCWLCGFCGYKQDCPLWE
jgi:hypothetical protein